MLDKQKIVLKTYLFSKIFCFLFFTLRSHVKTKLDPFGNVANLSDNLFSKSEFSLLNKNFNFCPRPNKTLTKIFLSFTVTLNLGHTLDQLKIIQMNLDLKAIAIGYQINCPGVLKLSEQLSVMI